MRPDRDPALERPNTGRSDTHDYSTDEDNSFDAGEGFDNPKGADETDRTAMPAAGGLKGSDLPKNDSGIAHDGTETTYDGGLAVEGGKLAGNQDDFEGELGQDVPIEPGAGYRHNEGLSNKGRQERHPEEER